MKAYFEHTKHSRIRAQQRCVTEQMIDDTIASGKLIRKQGLRFFIMTSTSLCYIAQKQYADRLKNTVVILNPDNTVRTVYKNARALRHISKKSKMLHR